MIKIDLIEINIYKRWIIRGIISFIILLGVALLCKKKHNPNAFLFYNYEQKIWAHRVNSNEKLIQALDKFKGIEFDVVFLQNDNDFDINHPPAKSIHLLLDKYCSIIPNPSNYHYWVDFKNLTSENKQQSLNKLNYLANKYKINKTNMVVESSNPSNLEGYTKAGYFTSYYLPIELSKLNEKDLRTQIDQIKININKYPSLAISSYFKDYPLMKKYFPKRNKLLWAPYGGDLEQKKLIRDLLKDDKVKALLVAFKVKVGDR